MAFPSFRSLSLLFSTNTMSLIFILLVNSSLAFRKHSSRMLLFIRFVSLLLPLTSLLLFFFFFFLFLFFLSQKGELIRYERNMFQIFIYIYTHTHIPFFFVFFLPGENPRPSRNLSSFSFSDFLTVK